MHHIVVSMCIPDRRILYQVEYGNLWSHIFIFFRWCELHLLADVGSYSSERCTCRGVNTNMIKEGVMEQKHITQVLHVRMINSMCFFPLIELLDKILSHLLQHL